MSYFPPMPLPLDPFLGGALSTGPTGLPVSLAGQLGNTAAGLPYASPSWMSGLASQAVANPAASGLARFMAPGVTGRAVAGRAGLGAAAGSIGSSLIDKTDIGGQNSNLEQGLQGAAMGAGLGATVGSVVPVLGTGLGAAAGGVVGGAIGVLGNMFGGGDDEAEVNPVQVLGTAIQSANLTPDATEEILSTYETLMDLAEGQPEGEKRDAAKASAYDTAAQMVLSMMQQQEQAPVDAANALALQQQSQQIFAPLADDIRQSGAAYSQAMGANRQYLPESYRAFADADVARELHSSNKLADAYMAQAAITPAVNQLTQYQQDFQGYAAQLFAQQMAQQAAGATGGGAQDISALLQPAP